MRVLLIEDDRTMARGIELTLRGEGFNVYTTHLGEDGVDLGKLYDYDLILLDLNLPDMSGMDVLRNLRVGRIATPVMILSASSEIDTKVKTLTGGADDYLTKPFNPRELLARIRAVLRRGLAAMSAEHSHVLVFDGWRIDANTRQLHDPGGARVALTGAEFDLLLVFCERPRRVLSRDQLIDLTQGRSAAPFERSIDVLVSRLRQKIEAEPKEPTLIQTIRSGGYLFSPDVKPA